MERPMNEALETDQAAAMSLALARREIIADGLVSRKV